MMKKIIIALLATVFGFVSYGQEAKNAYEISIKIKGLKQGDSLLMANHFGDRVLRTDTAVVGKNGFATFTGNKTLYRGMYLIATPDLKTFDFVVGKDQFFSLSTDSASYKFNENMKVEGSEENEVFYNYLKFISNMGMERAGLMAQRDAEKDSVKLKEIGKKMAGLNESVFKYQEDLLKSKDLVFPKILKAQKEPEIPAGMADSLQFMYFKNNYWSFVDFTEEAMVRAPGALLKTKIDKYFERLVFPDPDSMKVECDRIIKLAADGKSKEVEKYVIWYLGHRFQDMKIMCMDDVYVHILQNYYCKGRAWWVDSATREKMCLEAWNSSFVPCNGVAPNMRNYDTADNVVDLHASAGKITIVFFWDPTCGHCKKVVPLLDSIYDANKGKGWTIYAIASETKYVEWREYLSKHPEIHDWENVCKSVDDKYWNNQRAKYHNVSNPTIYILDQYKRIKAKKINEHKVAEFLKYLEELQVDP